MDWDELKLFPAYSLPVSFSPLRLLLPCSVTLILPFGYREKQSHYELPFCCCSWKIFMFSECERNQLLYSLTKHPNDAAFSLNITNTQKFHVHVPANTNTQHLLVNSDTDKVPSVQTSTACVMDRG